MEGVIYGRHCAYSMRCDLYNLLCSAKLAVLSFINERQPLVLNTFILFDVDKESKKLNSV